MQQVMVKYSDPYISLRDTFEAGPYPGDEAKYVIDNLKLMGCEDFKVVPLRVKNSP